MIDILFCTLLALVIILLIIYTYGSYVSSTPYIDKQIKKKINSKNVLKASTIRKIKNDGLLFKESLLIKEVLTYEGYLIFFAWLDYYHLLIDYLVNAIQIDDTLKRHLSHNHSIFHTPVYEELLSRIRCHRQGSIGQTQVTWSIIESLWKEYVNKSVMIQEEYGKYELEKTILNFNNKKFG